MTLLFCAACLAQSEGQDATPVPLQSTGQQTDVPPQVPAGSTSIPDAQINKDTRTPKAATPGAQPKRILGVMPNYRAVSAGAIPPPPTAKESFKIATQNSFDYSALIFVGITSLMAEGSNTHPQLHKGIEGYGRYYWRGFLDKTDGNYLVIFALPTLFHEDERYFAMGTGGWFKRAIYSASRILITPDYNGHNTFNAAEIFGRGISQGISGFYYPSQDRTAGALAVKYGWAIGRDALTNVFREFWPDISSHVLHRHPKTGTPTP
ncbi:MAG: hypothetical protein P4L56_24735 [Candidatus Sulfopaludibacter sp.]|nr:hypothetical protein [Candidatus Sulfopaludibacter sp.]